MLWHNRLFGWRVALEISKRKTCYGLIMVVDGAWLETFMAGYSSNSRFLTVEVQSMRDLVKVVRQGNDGYYARWLSRPLL